MIKRTLFFNFILMVFDVLSIVLSFTIGNFLKTGYFASPFTIVMQNSRLLLFATAVIIAVFGFFRLYDMNAKRSEVDEAGAVIGALTSSMLLFEFMTLFYRDMIFKRMTILYAWIFCMLFMVFIRVLSIAVQKWLYRKGLGVSRIVVIGDGKEADLLVDKVSAHPEMGLSIVEVLPVRDSLKVLGAALDRTRANKVIFASSDPDNKLIMELIEICEKNKAEFKFVPRVLDIIESRISADEVVGVPLISIREIKFYGFNAFVKRTSDIFYSLIAIILASPVILAVSILIKLDSRGHVFFVQKRVGRGGKEFNMYKFRSMIDGAETALSDIADKNEAKGHIFKMKNDPRVTRVGKFLRKWSLDELPQLFNVIKGDMSFVGPRPPIPSEVALYNSWHKKRLQITPGITGLWQTNGRSDLSFDEMVKLDIYYIESWSLWQDIKILMKTVPVVLFAKGAY